MEQGDYPEIYSQFSKGSVSQLRREPQPVQTLETLESLKKNEFFSKQTFEEFLERKKTGKRALFYLKPTRSQQVELYEQYRRQIAENHNAKMRDKAQQIAEERKRLEQINGEVIELEEISHERKQQQQLNTKMELERLI